MCADWNQLFLDPTKIIREPDPLALEFCRTLQPGARVLDLGCGAGRHLLCLSRAGFTVIGADLAPQGLWHAREWLQREGQPVALLLAAMEPLPFAASSFEGVLSINVLNHATLGQTRAAISGVLHLLKPGSPFFFIIIGHQDARCGEGIEIEPYTFIHQQGIEAGIPHHYYTRTEVEELINGFSRHTIEERYKPYNSNGPVFGHDPRLQGRDNLFTHHWVVRTWK